MQKVLRRTAQAQKQGKKLAQRQSQTEERFARSTYRREAQAINRERREAVQDERKRRRADWEAGPLSPRRNNTEQLMGDKSFGVWSISQVNSPKKPSKDRQKYLMLREGDRVAIAEGHESIKGRVGKIKTIDKEEESVIVEGVNRVDVKVPQSKEDIDRGQRAVQTIEMPIPYRALRLVYPLPDPSTGIPRDVIVNKLTAREKRFDVFENKEVFERWLEPQHVRIPWPEKEEPIYVDEPNDTLRVDTEDSSYQPTLIIPPMPGAVIDELRNKYSRYRTRHDEEYIERKEAEDLAEEIEQRRKEATMPRGASNIARRRGLASREDAGQLLSDDVAARIGQHIAASRPAASAERQSAQ